MASHKGSAKAKRVAEFKAQLGGGMDDVFARERQRRDEADSKRDAARRTKACERKNRYATQGEALQTIASCAEYGTKGLRTYRCKYCNGWHLTSHAQE